MKKRTTINDIAREAGVSRQTVSRAINGMGGISADTRERVLKTVDALGFRPNRLAQGMVNSQTHTIGLVIGNTTNPANAEVISAIHDGAQEVPGIASIQARFGRCPALGRGPGSGAHAVWIQQHPGAVADSGQEQCQPRPG